MTSLFYCSLLTTALFFSTALSLQAHPGGHGHGAGRTWTLTDGSTIQGSLLHAKENQVHVEQADGTVLKVEFERCSETDRQYVAQRQASIERVNKFFQSLQFVSQKAPAAAAQAAPNAKTPPPAMLEHFKPFEKTLQLRWDDEFFYVGSNGMPDHPMMIGIRAWQQQVPMPQKYFGDNAWRIPLHPVPAKKPMSAKENFFRGAIALAVNGVPIFNPIKNDGRTDTLVAGELDEYGGHCGRADDYHYHIAPVHLEKTIGPGKPLAYALDGYPIYGYQDEKALDYAPLDWLNGHQDKAGNYHYHATKTYPYINGGFYGVVTEREGQVDPQPRAVSPRPALPPLRDAKITKFAATQPSSYRLTYDLRGKEGTVSYTLADDGSAKFVFVDPSGKTTNETYTPRQRGPGGNDRPPRPGEKQPPPKSGDNPPPRNEERRPPRDEPAPTPPRGAAATKPQSDRPKLTVTSSSVDAKGFISVDCTCDGTNQAPAVQWKDAPKETKSFAISLWHIAPDQEKSYWLVYNIPADVTELKQNARGVGQLGLNGKRKAEYDPMCSKGPGVKKYHITVYALSAEPKLAADKTTRATLQEAIKDVTLAEGTLDFQYERKK